MRGQKRLQKRLIGLVLTLIILAIGVYKNQSRPPTGPAAQSAATSSATSPISTSTPLYAVHRVVDGDTIKILKDDHIVTLRLIGLDTPEVVDPRKPVQCFGREASNKAKEILTSAHVRIEEDPSQGTLDKYGRTLAYVFLEDGTLFNEYMIREGYGHEYTYRYPYKYQTQFKAAESDARTNKRGLWAPGVCGM